MKKCSNCGFESESNFCPQCGAPMSEVNSEINENSVFNQVPQGAPQEVPQEPVQAEIPQGAPQEPIQGEMPAQPQEAAQEIPQGEPVQAEIPQGVPQDQWQQQGAPEPQQNQYQQVPPQPGESQYQFGNYGDQYNNVSYNPPKKEKLVQRSWFIILALIVFWPLGIVLMWAFKKWNLAARIIISGLLALSLVAYIVGIVTVTNNYVESPTISTPTTEYVPDTSETVAGTDSTKSTDNRTAYEAAQSYLDFMAFSRSGLIKQLEFDGYSNADATEAVDKCNVNWREQAVAMAKEYLDVDGLEYDKEKMISQLEYEGFSKSDAEYGASKAGLK